ncbi:hypothetical protein BO86DRAFT_250222 [Aspergillus japonicus CBS 114.51]|uniref:Uncharacterized protein n=1 Tax=Aspergillus japonicus CBS 114.51 TaxID=1448312 RepID=A0A8T8WKS4_ASPJA|nr:hypothetical protein BO86DRAFT_250222 [Aspergillus japonicus CBS 114.51]RAH76471.1 hypothetical protein BO86DRAFT_250222 [Aspergillus japonicus CBS 114.51]
MLQCHRRLPEAKDNKSEPELYIDCICSCVWYLKPAVLMLHHICIIVTASVTRADNTCRMKPSNCA